MAVTTTIASAAAGGAISPAPAAAPADRGSRPAAATAFMQAFDRARSRSPGGGDAAARQEADVVEQARQRSEGERHGAGGAPRPGSLAPSRDEARATRSAARDGAERGNGETATRIAAGTAKDRGADAAAGSGRNPGAGGRSGAADRAGADDSPAARTRATARGGQGAEGASAARSELDARADSAARSADNDAPADPSALVAALLEARPAAAAPAHGRTATTALTDTAHRGAHRGARESALDARSARATAASAVDPSLAADDSRGGTQAAADGFAVALAATREPGARTADVHAAAEAAASLPATAQAALAAPPGAQGTTAPAQARLALGPGHPDFARQLGAQLTTFVRQGVEFARIELHPAELGPLTLQIQLDGQRAQVHFAAERVETRQALDAALPTLAGSLRDAGLTLAGGGVFQQPRDTPAQDGGTTPRPNAGRDAAAEGAAPNAAAAPAEAPTRRRGVVDLVA